MPKINVFDVELVAVGGEARLVIRDVVSGLFVVVHGVAGIEAMRAAFDAALDEIKIQELH